jgi:iron complex transport system ATP-binding protein
MIAASGLSFAYGDTTVVRDVSLTAEDGGVLGLIGPNGSGKTTLLRMLHGSLAPGQGHVTIDGQELGSLSQRDIARSLAVVVQEEQSEMSLTVGEMVLLGRTPHLRSFARAGHRDHVAAGRALQRVGAAHLARRSVAQLSGGERQRVLIARAVAQESAHLLLDGPANHLDIRYQHEVLSLVRHLGGTIVVVLHDLNLAARYCDRLVLLDRGAVAGAGTPDEVLQPDLIRRVYGIDARRVDVDGTPNLLFAPLRQEAA